MSFKRTAIWLASLLAALLVLMGIEVLLARGTRRLAAYSRDQLDGRVGADGGPALRLTWMGDSTGQGTGASDPDRVLPRLVAKHLERPVQVTVLAVSGARAADVFESQLPLLAATSPEWVVVGIGGNDVTHLTSRTAFRRRIDSLLDGIRNVRPERLIVVGIGHFASTPLLAQPLRWIAGLRAKALNEDLRNSAARHCALFVDIIERTGPEFVRDPRRFHAVDRFHPSDDGYALWSEAMVSAIREAG